MRTDPGTPLERVRTGSASTSGRGPSSTEPPGVPLERQRRSRAARRAGIASIGLVLVLGLANALGPRSATVEASASGMGVTVEYPIVTRPALAAVWQVVVHRDGGFPGKITIATTASYFRGFDYNALYPSPVSEAGRDDLVVYTFDRPPGDTFRVELDARATPTWTFLRRATTTVSGEGLPSVTLSYRTVFLP